MGIGDNKSIIGISCYGICVTRNTCLFNGVDDLRTFVSVLGKSRK